MPLTLLPNPPSCPPGLHAGSHHPRASPRESTDPPPLSPLRLPPTAGCPPTYPLFIGSQGDISKRPVWFCHAPIYSPCPALLCSWAPASVCDVPAGPSMIGSCLSRGPSSLMFCHQLCAPPVMNSFLFPSISRFLFLPDSQSAVPFDWDIFPKPFPFACFALVPHILSGSSCLSLRPSVAVVSARLLRSSLCGLSVLTCNGSGPCEESHCIWSLEIVISYLCISPTRL